MPETIPEERIAKLEAQVEALNTSHATLKSDVLTAMQALFEILDANGPLAIKLSALESALADLSADVRTSDDVVGDSRTIRAIESTLNEIKSKVGVRT